MYGLHATAAFCVICWSEPLVDRSQPYKHKQDKASSVSNEMTLLQREAPEKVVNAAAVATTSGQNAARKAATAL